ncbi:kinase-like domain-containing protein [Suillus variegatus]|nr:kinase-like domain-containing protein [Suillus variegatus]
MSGDSRENHSEEIHPELQLLSSSLLHHVNIVPFLGFKKDKPFHSLVMPWMPDGTLTSFIRTHKAVLETAAKATLDNVLITERHSACISGFRQSVRLSSRDATCPPSQIPPKPEIQFAGPEWFDSKDDQIFQHLPKTLFKSDTYSLGCIMFYVFTIRMPWHDATSVEISNQLRKRVTPSRPKGSIVDDKQWALIEPCLSLRPQKRPFILDVLNKIKDYLVSIGTPDLTGQIEKQGHDPVNRGGYGLIYEAIWKRKTGGQVKVAVKVMHVAPSRMDQVKKNLKRELAAWRRLSHTNIVSLLGTTKDLGLIEGMVSPWMKNGSLQVYLSKGNDVPLSKRLLLVEDIAEGLKYLHKHPVVHGDLTPSNVLIDDDERAVLTDFGLSIILGGFTNLSVTYTDAQMGTEAWAAPELFSDSHDSRGHNPSLPSDVYSFACLMYLIFTGSHLWNVTGPNTLLRVWKGERPSRPDAIDDTRYWSLIEECWDQKPSSRPKISDVLLRLRNITPVQR